MNPAPAGPLLRVVLDSNIHLAAFNHPRGRYAAFWKAARDRRYTLLISPAIAAEVARVLRTEFLWPEDRVQRAVRFAAQVAEIVQPRTNLRVVKADPDDDRILECALAGNADLIVSNDHHLRDLRTFRGIPIVAGSDFRRILGLTSRSGS